MKYIHDEIITTGTGEMGRIVDFADFPNDWKVKLNGNDRIEEYQDNEIVVLQSANA